MSKQRRTADDFVRDMKAKQEHSTASDIERKTSEGLTSPDRQARPVPTVAARNSRRLGL